MKWIYLPLAIAAVLTFSTPTVALATSGACSYHGGVDCSAGADFDGSVICNDGWRDSSVYYSNMVECQQTTYCPTPFSSGCKTQNDYNVLQAQLIQSGTSMYAPEMAQSSLAACSNQISTYQASVAAYQACLTSSTPSYNAPAPTTTCPVNSSLKSDGSCYCNDGFVVNKNKNACITKSESCAEIHGAMSVYQPLGDKCACAQYYGPNLANPFQCIPLDDMCAERLGAGANRISPYYDDSEPITKSCQCGPGTVLGTVSGKPACVQTTTVPVVASQDTSTPTTDNTPQILTVADGAPVSSDSLSSRLSGQILLQVEDLGKAWYIRPEDGHRYYMADGNVAYQMMRSFGLGITDSDLSTIPAVDDPASMKTSGSTCSSNSVAKRLSGKILLQVQQHGEAWYVFPDKCRRIYLKDGAAAYSVMRYLSLGISNVDIAQIDTGVIGQ